MSEILFTLLRQMHIWIISKLLKRIHVRTLQITSPVQAQVQVLYFPARIGLAGSVTRNLNSYWGFSIGANRSVTMYFLRVGTNVYKVG